MWNIHVRKLACLVWNPVCMLENSLAERWTHQRTDIVILRQTATFVTETSASDYWIYKYQTYDVVQCWHADRHRHRMTWRRSSLCKRHCAKKAFCCNATDVFLLCCHTTGTLLRINNVFIARCYAECMRLCHSKSSVRPSVRLSVCLWPSGIFSLMFIWGATSVSVGRKDKYSSYIRIRREYNNSSSIGLMLIYIAVLCNSQNIKKQNINWIWQDILKQNRPRVYAVEGRRRLLYHSSGSGSHFSLVLIICDRSVSSIPLLYSRAFVGNLSVPVTSALPRRYATVIARWTDCSLRPQSFESNA